MKIKINPKQHKGKTLLEICKDYNEDDLILPDYTSSAAATATEITLTSEHLMLMTPSLRLDKAVGLTPDINMTLKEFGISANFERTVFFMSNLLHESGEFKYSEELASGKAYETRVDLGNTPEHDGDGPRHKGFGWMQNTGKENHRLFGEYIINTHKWNQLYCNMYDQFPEKVGNPVLHNPKIQAVAPWNSIVSGWFWKYRAKLNPIADTGNFEKICVRINGGYNGYDDRVKYLNWCMAILDEFKHLSVVPNQQYKIKRDAR